MPSATSTKIAIVGTGYVADSYGYTLANHVPALELSGVYDKNAARMESFAQFFKASTYPSLDALLSDKSVSIVVNLTDPHAHLEVSQQILGAGKHLYTEKPLGMRTADAIALRSLANKKALRIAAAPCNFLGEAAQTMWKAVRAEAVGKIRLVYADFDDGIVHQLPHANWINATGKMWPADGEFTVGCTFEHAGYSLGPLMAMFGPVRRVTAFATLAFPDKLLKPSHEGWAPDVSVGCLEFESGVVARLTNSVAAPYDHRLRLIGEHGVLSMSEPWDYGCAVKQSSTASGRVSRFLERRFGFSPSRTVPAVRPVPFKRGRRLPTMDFMRGVRELADAIRENRPSRLDADFAVHITEVTEILQYPERFERPAIVQSRFNPIRPMDWAL